jgi:hypothetical protein
LANLTVNPLPDNSLAVSDPTVCAGEDATITLSNSVVGVSYQLRLDSDDSNVGAAIAGTGGDIDFVLTSPAVSANYNVLATVDATSCEAELTDLANLTVNPLPDNSLAVSDPTVCAGEDATITLSNSVVGVSYQLRLDSDDSNVGAAIAGTGGDIDFVLTSPAASANYNVLATVDATSCEAELTDLANLTVNPLPDNSLAVSDPTVCAGEDATITLSNSVVGVSYQLRLDSDDSNVGAAIAGTGGILTLYSPLRLLLPFIMF